MSDDKDTPQGPTDPHGQGGIDAPAGPTSPGEPARDSGKPTEHGQEPVGAGDHHDEPTQDQSHREQQEENAGTHLDEPSDGSGGE